MKEERINIAIIVALLIIVLFEGLLFFESIGIINDKTAMIQELQKENNQCNMQLDSITHDYERLQHE